MKKILFILFFCLAACLNLYSQTWEIASHVLANKIASNYNNDLKVHWAPYINCFKEQTVTFLGARNTFKKFNYARKDTGKEIDEDKQWAYINKKYFVEDIVYDVEDFLGDGVLFVLRDSTNKYIYVQLSYRNIDKYDALAKTFKEAPCCDSYWKSQVINKTDKFTDVFIRQSSCVRFTSNNKGFIYFSQSMDTDSLYSVTIMLGSNIQNTISQSDCFIIFDDGQRFSYKSIEIYVYDNNCKGDFCFYYITNLILTHNEFLQFTEHRITDIRLLDIDVLNISQVYGQRVMQSCNALYNYDN